MRAAFAEELEQLRLQVEVMALRVDEALAHAVEVIETGDHSIAEQMLACDDEIDQMHVSLTERCYELMVREGPVASDFRLVMSVVRVLSALERIGDLCLRIANQADEMAQVRAHPALFSVIHDLAENVRARFGLVCAAWSANDLAPLSELSRTGPLEEYAEALLGRILELDGADAVRVAVAAFVTGRSLDRIGDQTDVMAIRLQYLVTGDIDYLAQEVT